MLQANAIWVVESKKQLDVLNILRPKLRYRTAVTMSECDVRTLPDYDMVLFLLTPTQIGNVFFVEAIQEVLKVRRNAKTLFFAIDDCYRLEERELVKVVLELKASIRNFISNPAVYTVSTYYAMLHEQYEKGDITLEDLRHNRDVLIPLSDSEVLTGRQLMSEHIQELLTLSKLDQLYALIEQFGKGLYSAGIDTAKQNWLITGPSRAGKSLLASLLQSHSELADSIHFADDTSDPTSASSYYDGLILVLPPELRQCTEYLEQIGSTYAGLRTIIVINKFDSFMYFGCGRTKLQEELLTGLRGLTGDPVYFVSAYYYEQYEQWNKQKVSYEDIIANPELVLMDSMEFPVSKQKQGAQLPELLLDQSGFPQLLQHWE
ncbi:hypothetical protein RAC89_00365 [Paenibacillus sp. GD4]|uniref:hypothetical protein n=1 Tax=Paenibacillus sp. GD4 TaxID=3068890 RepID=UPI002796AEA1|nr:hypothetical protein [Paenibacillus sp. GD4]MDQ1908951.1 hypothetical protein [Paenibacillus sp. GD4]